MTPGMYAEPQPSADASSQLRQTAEPPRIGNPFQSFRTRSYWLTHIILRAREAHGQGRPQPDWFNR